jgi:hypothetical protein
MRLVNFGYTVSTAKTIVFTPRAEALQKPQTSKTLGNAVQNFVQV